MTFSIYDMPVELSAGLASSALHAIEQASIPHHAEISDIHDAFLAKLRNDAHALLIRKPDPLAWTAAEHHVFILGTTNAFDYHIAEPAAAKGSAEKTAPTKSFDTPRDAEIPF